MVFNIDTSHMLFKRWKKIKLSWIEWVIYKCKTIYISKLLNKIKREKLIKTYFQCILREVIFTFEYGFETNIKKSTLVLKKTKNRHKESLWIVYKWQNIFISINNQKKGKSEKM